MFRIFCQNKTISRHRKQPFQICILLRSINASTIFREPPLSPLVASVSPCTSSCITRNPHTCQRIYTIRHTPHSQLTLSSISIYAISRCLVDGLCVWKMCALCLYTAHSIYGAHQLFRPPKLLGWIRRIYGRRKWPCLPSCVFPDGWELGRLLEAGSPSVYNRSRCKATIPEFIYKMLLVSMHTPTADLCSALICMQNFGAEFMYTLLLNEQHVNFVKCDAMHIYILVRCGMDQVYILVVQKLHLRKGCLWKMLSIDCKVSSSPRLHQNLPYNTLTICFLSIFF